MESEAKRYFLQVLEQANGEDLNKATVVVQNEIEQDRIKAVVAGAYGLAYSRTRKQKPAPYSPKAAK